MARKYCTESRLLQKCNVNVIIIMFRNRYTFIHLFKIKLIYMEVYDVDFKY